MNWTTVKTNKYWRTNRYLQLDRWFINSWLIIWHMITTIFALKNICNMQPIRDLCRALMNNCRDWHVCHKIGKTTSVWQFLEYEGAREIKGWRVFSTKQSQPIPFLLDVLLIIIYIFMYSLLLCQRHLACTVLQLMHHMIIRFKLYISLSFRMLIAAQADHDKGW